MLHRKGFSFPLVLALLFGLAISFIPVSPALSDNITACQGTGTATSRLKLGGRTITPTLILQAATGTTCPTGETSLGLVSLSRTIIVSPVVTPTQNGTALLAAMQIISNSNPSAANPWLLKLEPGNYDLGSQSLTLKPYVDLEGSGEGNTIISSNVGTLASPPDIATLIAASNSEVRLLQITNSGNTNNHVAVLIPAATDNARFTHFTTSASGGNLSYGLYKTTGTLTLTDATLVGSGSSSTNRGLYNDGGSINILSSSLTGFSGVISYGFENNSGNSTISNTVLSASGGSVVNYALLNGNNATATGQNSTFTGSGGTDGYGVVSVAGGTSVKVVSSQLYGSTLPAANLSVCPFSVNANTFAPLTNGTC